MNVLPKSICTANIFFAGKVDTRKGKELSQILGQFKIDNKDIPQEGRFSFDVTGITGEETDSLARSLLVYLDPSKRSLLNYLSQEGSLKTILIKEGQVFVS